LSITRVLPLWPAHFARAPDSGKLQSLMIKVTFPDGSVKEVEAGSTPLDIANLLANSRQF
jgi:hypothetical protein